MDDINTLPPSIQRWRTVLLPLGAEVPSIGRITLAGTLKNNRGILTSSPRVFGQWAWVLVVRGSGRYRDVLGTDKEVNAGDWILVFPEIGHWYGPTQGKTWDEIYVCFRGPLFDLWREAGFLSPRAATGRLNHPAGAYRRMAALLHQLSDPEVSPAEVIARWQLFLAATCTSTIAGQESPTDPRLRRACAAIEGRIHDPDPGWDAVCRETGIGYESLRKLFREHLRTSPFRYRTSRRMERAMFLAETQKYPAKKVAQLLGFHDEAHFSRAFRQATGRTYSNVVRPE